MPDHLIGFAGAIIVDPELKLTGWSLVGEQIFLDHSGALLQKTLQDLLAPVFSAPALQELIGRVQRVFAAQAGQAIVLPTRSGQPVLVSVFPWQDRQGRQALISFRDMQRQVEVEEALQQRNQELSGLLSISRKLGAQTNLDELLPAITTCVVETLPHAEAASLMLYDEPRDRLVVRSYAGMPLRPDTLLEFDPRRSLVGLVFQGGSPWNIPDTAADPRFEPVGDLVLDSVRSVIGAPLIVKGRCLGAIFADNYTRTAAFSEPELGWLQSLAGQAAVIIQNAQLFEQVSQAGRRMHALSQRLVDVQEGERRRLASELHDEIGQGLTGLKLMLEGWRRRPSGDLEQEYSRLQIAITEMMGRVRELSLALRPAVLDDYGLLSALLWHIERYNAQTGVEANLKHSGIEGRRFGIEIETAAYRVVQEALTNVARHAGAHAALVVVSADDQALSIRVEDNGCGFDAGRLRLNSRAFGLVGMRERVLLLNGMFNLTTAIGAGVQLSIRLPLAAAQGEE
ncbi:MAG: GAF domain-containing protein [Chloroflexota bacterium]